MSLFYNKTMATLFHEIDPDKQEHVLGHGLKQGDRGSKRDAAINKADAFLREFQPAYLVHADVDRQANVFCYLPYNEQAIDITSGDARNPAVIASEHGMTMLRIEADQRHCYASDIDLYDQIKDLLVAGKVVQARQLAPVYWKHVIPLAEYSEQFSRPEVLVTCDVPPAHISMTT